MPEFEIQIKDGEGTSQEWNKMRKIISKNDGQKMAKAFEYDCTNLFGGNGIFAKLYAAYLGDELVGLCGISDDTQGFKRYNLSWVQVAEKHQGKGIGPKLVEHAIKVARQKKAKRLSITTKKPDFFKKLGFKKIDKVGKETDMRIKL